MKPTTVFGYLAGAVSFAAIVGSPISPADAQIETDVRIVVEQSYEARGPLDSTFEPLPFVDLPILDLVEDIVFATGGNVVDGATAGGEFAVIAVTVKGRALGRRYLDRDNAYLYTGAQLNGEVRLTMPSGDSISRTFASLTPMPFQLATVNLGYDRPENAPFGETLDRTGGLAGAVVEVIVAVWGVEAIIPAALDGDGTVRADVANLLGDLGDDRAVPALIEALEFDDDSVVRQRAAWSLGRIGDSRAIPSLIEALNDVSADVRWFAAWSLRSITGQDIGPDYDVWSDWWTAIGDESEG